MRRLLSPFVILFTLLILICYFYAAHQLTPHLFAAILFALPFLSIWLVPILYWFGDQSETHPWTHRFQSFAYLSMGWLNYVFVSLIPLNLLSLLFNLTKQKDWASQIDSVTAPLTFVLSFLALGLGLWRAKRGPSLREVKIPVPGLDPALDQLRMVQISDLHVGPTIHKSYVERVVEQSNALNPDLVLLTGDIVDGTVKDLAAHVAPLANLSAKYGVYFILGNHDYYSGADAWIPVFRSLGMKILLNSHELIKIGAGELLIAGVLDPAVKGFSKDLKPDPLAALGSPERSLNIFRILLAHNPKLAPEGARAGFNLQVSGHTHAGQFIPWTWVTKWIHAPHYAGLSKEGKMWVYVSAGTGSWGPPLRLGTSPELTLLSLEGISSQT